MQLGEPWHEDYDEEEDMVVNTSIDKNNHLVS